MSKARTPGLEPLSLLDRVVPIYASLLGRLAAAGAVSVQFDEPVLSLDLDEAAVKAFGHAYETLALAAGRMAVCLATYFGPLRENLDLALRLPVACVHLDLVRGPEQLKDALARVPDDKSLSLGVVNGRNVWKSQFSDVLPPLEKALRVLGAERMILAPSCSLLHCPVDLKDETDLPEEIRERLAFALQKLEELSVLRTVAGFRPGRCPIGPCGEPSPVRANRRVAAHPQSEGAGPHAGALGRDARLARVLSASGWLDSRRV